MNKVVVQIRFSANSVEDAITRVRQYMACFEAFQILDVYLIEERTERERVKS